MRCRRLFDDLMAMTMKSCVAVLESRRGARGSSTGRVRILGRLFLRMCRFPTKPQPACSAPCPSWTQDLRNLFAGGPTAGSPHQGSQPVTFPLTISARRVSSRRLVFIASLRGRRTAWPPPTPAALQRVIHGQQNAYRRLPPRGNSGCGVARKSRSRI
jgi:hypothetical protein